MTSQSHYTARFSNVVSPSLSRRNFPELLATLVLVSLACFGSTVRAQAVALGTATQYGVLAGSAVTNTGPSIVDGFLGISPSNASSVTGFPPGQVLGQTHFADAAALQAQNDLTTAYNDLASRSCGTTITADLGGQTLVPGVYCAATSMGLTGTLTLDAQGDPNALFVFQIGSTLTTASNSAVSVINSGQDCNVFWQIGSSATLGTTTDFRGTIVALSSITLNTGANVGGRVLARNGAVTLDGNGVSVCSIGGGPQGGSTGIPTLSQWSMLMLATVLILFGVLGFRRYTM